MEARETAKLALPMVLSQLGQVAMTTTDLLFIGRMGTEMLAAAALAGRVYLVFFTFGLGLLAAIAPVAGRAFGAGNTTLVRRSLRMGLWEASLLSLPIMACALHGEAILLALGQSPDAARLAQQHLSGLAWGVAPALGFQAIRSFMGAVNRPGPVLWIMLAAIPINALLVYILVHGKIGVPPLGLFGAGLATSVVNWGTFLAALLFLKTRFPLRDNIEPAEWWRFDWPLLRQLIVIGAPISMSTLTGYGVSSIAALLAGRMSTIALAAHQIAAQVGTILFMISYGISMAAAVRISHAVGRNDSSAIKRAGLVAVQLGMVIATIVAAGVVVARFEIAQLFLAESSDDVDATAGLTGKLLFVGAAFYVADAAGTIATGGLRGLTDTRVPLLLACIAYGLVSISAMYVLSLTTYLGAVGIWLGLSIGSTIYGGLLIVRFWLLANRVSLQGDRLSCVK
ncbi:MULTISPECIES: MATE family efflux transporter [unclassified Bradyrhizobium]|uniref:MATE family efflux transporter n=1 Tax=unclassified Bradyrhizobium TaxID=2631580 RepID=UPI00339B9545